MTSALHTIAARADGLSGRLFDFLGVARPANAFDRNNAISVFLMGALPAVAGSTISILLGMFFVWGLISLALRRFPLRLTPLDRLMAWTFTGFAVLILLTGLLADEPLQAFRASIWLIPFLSLWVVIPRLRASPDLDYLQLYMAGAIAGCIGALAFAAVEAFALGVDRPEGGAGNAVVFASMCLCLAAIASLAIDAPRRMHRILSAVAVIAGFTAIVLSLTRGVLLAGVPVAVAMLAYAPARWRSIAFRPTTLAAVAVAIVVLFVGWSTVEQRIEGTLAELGEILREGHSTSIGERLRLWGAAWSAFMESPLTGQGIQNRMWSLVPHLVEDGREISFFTHPHNGYLAFAVDGGIVVLSALLALLAVPVVVAWRAPRDAAWRTRLFLAVLVVTSYATFGLTQIMFKHDILDAFYIFTAMVVVASIPDRERGAG